MTQLGRDTFQSQAAPKRMWQDNEGLWLKSLWKILRIFKFGDIYEVGMLAVPAGGNSWQEYSRSRSICPSADRTIPF